MAESEDATDLKAQLGAISKETSFLKKYFALRKRCEQLQQSNEKIVNRIQHVKKLIKRYKRDKRYLSNYLDERGDDYRDAQVPLMWEEDQLYSSLRTPGFFQGTGSESETEAGGKYEHKIAPSSIQPFLQAHGMGSMDAAKLRKIKIEKEKDPNAPKKPANAFLMFCTTHRTSVQEEYFKEHSEEIAHHELTKSLAQQWNALVPEEKRIYYEMYEREKERYEREMRSYKPKPDPESVANTITSSELNLSSTGEAVCMSFKEELDV